jgi:hypothetical protein
MTSSAWAQQSSSPLTQRTTQATQATQPATPPLSEDQQAARAAFERGVQALEDSRFAEAQAAFEESFRRNPLPVVLYNLAFAYRGLGRNRDAIATLERFLQDPGGTEVEMQQQAREEATRLRATLVRLNVRPTPSNANVLIDGRRATVEGGIVVIDPGRRVIEVMLDGYRPHREERVFQPGESAVSAVTLSIIDDAGRLRIEPSVPSARVTIDGAYAGTGIVERPARLGVHRVVITADGYLPLERIVRVGGTGLVRVDATLQRPRPNPWPWLGPTIGLGTAAAIAGIAVGIAVANPTLESPPLNNCWDCGTTP